MRAITFAILAAMAAAALAPAALGAQDFLRKPITGTKNVLFYRLSYEGTPALPLTTPCNGTLGTQAFIDLVEDVLSQNSYGRMQVVGTAAGTGPHLFLPMPHTLSYYDTGCDDSLLAVLQDARNRALILGFDYQDYDYEVLITKKFWTNGPFTGGGFNRNFRVSFCGDNGQNLLDLVLHEMGHGFKFEHASYWDADPYELTEGCLEEYGDKFDVMGQVDNPQGNCQRHFALRHKVWARWYPPGPVPYGVDPIDHFYPIVTQSGDYTIRKIEGSSTHLTPRGLRILRDSEWTYYVTYRGDDPAADDQCAGDSCNGALITRSRDTNLRPTGNTQLLNTEYDQAPGCPSSSVPPSCSTGLHNWCGAVLNLNEAFYDPAFFGAAGDGVLIEVTEVTETRIKVRVTFDQEPLDPIDPLPVIDILSPVPGEILSGCTEIRVTARDPDDGSAHFAGLSKIVIGVGEVGGGGYAASMEFTSPSLLGYESWTIDTACLYDGSREFFVEAHEAGTSKVRKIRFRFLCSNGNQCCGDCTPLLPGCTVTCP